MNSHKINNAIPIREGVGFKPIHFRDIIETHPDIGWFEVHPENYMVQGGSMHHYLTTIREHYPLSLHGVGLSLGSADGVCDAHVQALKKLIDRYQPGLVSEHLSWSRFQETTLNDLLPVPYTHEALRVFSNNIDDVQNKLGRQILIENPSSYIELTYADYTEYDFLVTLAKQSGALILLDVNNVYVSATNHHIDAEAYIKAIPPSLVSEIHLAGHSVQSIPSGNMCIDDHGCAVAEAVWNLYQLTLDHVGAKPTLIEWDSNIPEWPVLYQEAKKVSAMLNKNSVAV